VTGSLRGPSALKDGAKTADRRIKMSDMLVKLYTLKDTIFEDLSSNNIIIKKPCITDKDAILSFVNQNFRDEQWTNECEYALFNNPISCFIAVKDKELIGFSCYDATAKGFFGPLGVKDAYRKMGVGKALLKRALYSMKEYGYAYAIIGWVAEEGIRFYQKSVNAVLIEDSPPHKSIYRNMLSQEYYYE
jgi:GNAT superfamily N-acetyltransferase